MSPTIRYSRFIEGPDGEPVGVETVEESPAMLVVTEPLEPRREPDPDDHPEPDRPPLAERLRERLDREAAERGERIEWEDDYGGDEG